jgi:hypothetical protein
MLCLCDLYSQVRKMSAIGSSTTGGTGSFPLDSSWVRRFSYYYKNQLGLIDSAYNRGVGGYSCYKGMPSGYVPPGGRPGPDPNNNVSKALGDLSGLADPAYGVIIINYPSNEYIVYSIAEIMFCLQTMYDLAVGAGHKCYVTTTQPRTDGAFGTSENKRKLAVIKDSIINRFGAENVLNFYDGMFNPVDSTILPIYSAGDNIHFNNAGHRILFQRVVAKDVFNLALPVTLEQFTATLKQDAVELQWTAHHDDPDTYFEVQRSDNGIQFETIRTVHADNNGGGKKTYRHTDNWPITGIAFYRLEIHERAKKYYSGTVSVKLATPRFTIKKIYTTRTSQNLTLEIISPQVQNTRMDIISSNGAVVKSYTRQLFRNTNIIHLPVAGLPAGSYFLRITSPGSAPAVQTFVK